jgi:hypothetical protein
MKAIWVFLIIGVGCYLFLVKAPSEQESAGAVANAVAP